MTLKARAFSPALQVRPPKIDGLPFETALRMMNFAYHFHPRSLAKSGKMREIAPTPWGRLTATAPPKCPVNARRITSPDLGLGKG
jgi:hypothetical protein